MRWVARVETRVAQVRLWWGSLPIDGPALLVLSLTRWREHVCVAFPTVASVSMVSHLVSAIVCCLVMVTIALEYKCDIADQSLCWKWSAGCGEGGERCRLLLSWSWWRCLHGMKVALIPDACPPRSLAFSKHTFWWASLMLPGGARCDASDSLSGHNCNGTCALTLTSSSQDEFYLSKKKSN